MLTIGTRTASIMAAAMGMVGSSTLSIEAPQSQRVQAAGLPVHHYPGSGKQKKNPRKCPPQKRPQGSKWSADEHRAMNSTTRVKNPAVGAQIAKMHQGWEERFNLKSAA